jgi:hypothetical protein
MLGEDGMHGVPADLNLTGFHGATLIQIGVAEHTLHFVFQSSLPNPLQSIMVESSWEIRDADGAILDRVQEHAARDVYRIHRLLSHDVVSSVVDAPRSFTLRFNSGHQLQIFDDSPKYESFSIQPGDTYV